MRNDDGFSPVGAPNDGALPPGAGGVGGASCDNPMPGGTGAPGNEAAGPPSGSLGSGATTSARAAPDATSSATKTANAQRY